MCIFIMFFYHLLPKTRFLSFFFCQTDFYHIFFSLLSFFGNQYIVLFLACKLNFVFLSAKFHFVKTNIQLQELVNTLSFSDSESYIQELLKKMYTIGYEHYVCAFSSITKINGVDNFLLSKKKKLQLT